MKKRIYFIISAILQILISLHTIMYVQDYIPKAISYYEEMYEVDNDKLWLESINAYKMHGEEILYVLSGIVIVLSSVILFNLIRKKEKFNNHPFILIAGIICFIFSENDYIVMLSLINIIVWIIGIKKENKKSSELSLITNDEIKSSKEEIPILEKYTYEKFAKFMAVLAILLYIFLPNVVGLLPFSYITLSIILDALLLLMCILIFKKELKIGIKNFWQNKKHYLGFIIKKQALMFIFYCLAALIIVLIKGDNSVSVNQQLAESLPWLYVIPTSLIYAPIVEELLFRGSFRRLIRNDKVFIVISGLLFGLLHTLYESTLIDVLLLSLPYCVIGGYLAYLYVKTNNITTPIVGHFIHNAFACLMMLAV